jgi:hypothetical protein
MFLPVFEQEGHYLYLNPVAAGIFKFPEDINTSQHLFYLKAF